MKLENELLFKTFMIYASCFNLWLPGGPNWILSSQRKKQNQHFYIYYSFFEKENIISNRKTKEETKVPMPRTINAKTKKNCGWLKVMINSPK